jgi:hypothetical protein
VTTTVETHTFVCEWEARERERELFPHPLSQNTRPFDGYWPPEVLSGGYIP